MRTRRPGHPGECDGALVEPSSLGTGRQVGKLSSDVNDDFFQYQGKATQACVSEEKRVGGVAGEGREGREGRNGGEGGEGGEGWEMWEEGGPDGEGNKAPSFVCLDACNELFASHEYQKYRAMIRDAARAYAAKVSVVARGASAVAVGARWERTEASCFSWIAVYEDDMEHAWHDHEKAAL